MGRREMDNTLDDSLYLADNIEAYLELTQHFLVDEVLIGDIQITKKSLVCLKDWIESAIITLPLYSVEESLPGNFYVVHQNRSDVAADVVRSTDSRMALKG